MHSISVKAGRHMKILITGAAGFIGSHAAERLAAAGYDITGIDNFSPYYSPELKRKNADALRAKAVRMIRGDLRNAADYGQLPDDFDYIFHFAAHPGISRTSSFKDYLENNIVGTERLLQFAQKCPSLKLFTNISTSSVYGADATQDENAVPVPVSDYGVTKLAAEQLVLSASRNAKLNACSLRLYSVYGPGERPDKLFTKLLKCLLHDEIFPLFAGSESHLRSFTYVSDIIDAVTAVLGKEKLLRNEVINIGSDMQHTTREGIETAELLTGKKIRAEILPPRPGDQSSTKAIIDKAKKLLDYNPRTGLRAGLEQQLAWIKEAGFSD